MPFKTCPHCETKNGVRSLKCKKCEKVIPSKKKSGGDFVGQTVIEAKKGTVTVSKTKRRRKIKRASKYEHIHWEDLRRDDLIVIKQGTGPYYLDSAGQRTYTSVKGTYRVTSLEKNGICVFGEGKCGGHQFIYMGKSMKSPIIPSLYREKHVIRKLRAPANVAE